MKKKVIALFAVLLLLGVSTAAYAAPASNCLKYANNIQGGLCSSNSLYDVLNNRSTACGEQLGCSALDSDGNAVTNSACLRGKLCSKLGKNAGVGGSCGSAANSTCPTGTSNAANASNAAGNATVSIGDMQTALNELKQQFGNSPAAITATCSSKNGINLSDFLQKFLAKKNCPTTPAVTAKPSEAPVVTVTPAATAAPTATPAATAKPTATAALTATPAATTAPTATPAATEKPGLPSGADNLAYEKEVVELVNEQRAANGLAPLTLGDKLSKVARLKSQDMHDNSYFSHTSPTYGSPFDMMKTFGISYRTAGENIAMGYSTPEAVVNGWMNSPGHRANILNANFTTIGVGYVADGHYWTQEFIG